MVRGQNGSLELSAHAGATPDTLETISRFLKDPSRSYAFSLRALETGTHATCNDIAHNPEAASWREEALRRGFRALVSLPLTVAGRRAGVFILYAGDTEFFDEEELRLLDELAADIGFSLEASQHEQARQRAETALRMSEARYRGLVDQSLDVVFRFNREGRLTFVNSAVTTLLGFSPDELIGQPMTALLTEASAKAAADSLHRRLHGGFGAQPVTQEYALSASVRK
jgi:PAS domain-containing protein